ncbi:MAG: hypothetical protein JWR05_1054 [Mucilaginibacter sp.]|nr:hypothetical protein [Mucilaginibacter sp.]
MKKSITLLALILAVSTVAFAQAPADDIISIIPSPKSLSIGVSIENEDAGKSVVTFYNEGDNEANTAMFKDKLASKGTAAKAYLLDELETGNYTMEVASDKQVVKKRIHVYDEAGKKTYFIFQ